MKQDRVKDEVAMTSDEQWIASLREFMRTGETMRLESAVHQTADADIKAVLALTAENKGVVSDHVGMLALTERLEKEGRKTAGAALRLLALHPIAVTAQSLDRFAPEGKKIRVELTLWACKTCLNISRDVHFDELTAMFGTILGAGLALMRQFSHARKVLEESLSLYRQLAEREPHIYLPDVAMTLNNLGNVLNEQHAFPEAQKVYEEALAIYRRLAEREPHIYLPYVATTLNNLGNVLDEQHAFPEAQKGVRGGIGHLPPACRT